MNDLTNVKHPYMFYRKDNLNAPMRPLSKSSANPWLFYQAYKKNMFKNLGFEPRKHIHDFDSYRYLLDKVDDAEWEGDKVMDEVVAQFKLLSGGKGRKIFEKILEDGIESVDNPPQAFVELAKQIDELPNLFDMDKVHRAVDKLASMPLITFYIGNLATLMTAANLGIASRALAATGRFTDPKRVLNRLVESFAYLHGNLMEDKAFDRESDALKNGVRIRLMHALVRAKLMASDDKGVNNFDERGNPISMRTAAMGSVGFVMNFMFIDTLIGGKASPSDYEDIAELGRVVSYVNGADEDVLAKSVWEQCLYMDYYLSSSEGPTEYTEKLNQSTFFGLTKILSDGQNTELKRKILYWFIRSFVAGIILGVFGKKFYQEMPNVPRLNLFSYMVMPAIKYSRITYDFFNKLIPGYGKRVKARMEFNRNFTKEGFPDFVSKLTDKEKEVVTYEGHDNPTT